jgi:hypothetical protein
MARSAAMMSFPLIGAPIIDSLLICLSAAVKEFRP